MWEESSSRQQVLLLKILSQTYYQVTLARAEEGPEWTVEQQTQVAMNVK